MNLKLNDFQLFDSLLFSNKECSLPTKKRWEKFITKSYRSSNIVDIPIPHPPQTLAEYQFCHYVYWMCIWAGSFYSKPAIRYKWNETEMRPHVAAGCFACEYKWHPEDGRKRGSCPIAIYGNCTTSIGPCNIRSLENPYPKWFINLNPDAAYDIAHLEWGYNLYR